jgi:hypothetical protein
MGPRIRQGQTPQSQRNDRHELALDLADERVPAPGVEGVVDLTTAIIPTADTAIECFELGSCSSPRCPRE